MKQFLINQRNRFFYGALLMALTGFGIPFIPFVPFAMLLGCWDLYGRVSTSGAFGEALGSIGTTFIIGVIGYAVVIGLLISKYA